MRKYRPDIGRWMSRDPMGAKGGVNIYALCGNQVTSNVDSLGNDPRYDYSFLSWSKNITYHNANDTVFKSGKGGSRSWGLTKASEILRSISPKIVKVGECCAKVEHGFGYKISIFQHLLDISAINQVVTKRGYEDILAHENRRGQVYLNGFYKYYGLIAGETELSLKCNTLCRSEGWESAKEALEEYLSALEFEIWPQYYNYILIVNSIIGKDNRNFRQNVISDSGDKLIDGYEKIFDVPDPPPVDIQIECPESNVK